ncbi:MAG: hypothetical protein RR140_00330 [Clostridia bacterium]
MKRFFMYLIVATVIIFVGLTTYYAVRNVETINLTAKNGEIKANIGDTFDMPLKINQQHARTIISEPDFDANILSYNKNTKVFTALAAGNSYVDITTNHKGKEKIEFNVIVGNGSPTNPYYISCKNQLSKIGGADWGNDKCYELTSDINLNNEEWAPIKNFSGEFYGNGFCISNLKVTQNQNNAGLFSNILPQGKVEGLKFLNVNLTGSFANAGAVAGTSNGFVNKIDLKSVNINNTSETSCSGGAIGSAIYKSGGKPQISLIVCDSNIVSCGVVGGIVGSLTDGVVNNCKSTISANVSGKCFGGVVGTLKSNQKNTVVQNSLSVFKVLNLEKSKFIGGTIGGVEGNRLLINNNYFVSNLCFANSSLIKGCSEQPAINLFSKSTYKSWNFKDVWEINDGIDYATILEDAEFEHCGIFEVGETIQSNSTLKSAFEYMRNNPSEVVEYNIISNIDLNLNGAEWAPIGTQGNPFCGKIVVKDKVSVKISNFKITKTYENVGFFGCTGMYFVINNVNFSNVQITANASSLGVIVGENSGKVLNCGVENILITSQSSVIGGIVGINNGDLKETTINKDYLSANGKTILSTGSDGVIGGICGVNNSNIISCIADQLEIATNSKSDTTLKVIGGIAGKSNAGEINKCNSYVIVLGENGSILSGGIVGESKNSIISHCKSMCTITSGAGNTNSRAGGIVGVAGASTLIESCSTFSTISAEVVGGLTYKNYGEIKNSSVEGGITSGKNISGLSHINGGKINDCMALGVLQTTTETVACGLSNTLEKGSSINNCFSNVIYTGDGTEKYVESKSAFRTIIESDRQNIGTLTNCISINYGTAYIQKNIFGTGDFIYCTKEEATGKTGNFAKFINAGFSSLIWNFDNVGDFPILKTCVTFA